MKHLRIITLFIFLAGVTFTGVGCRKETKMEKIKRTASEAAEKTSDAVKEATED